MPDPQPTDTPAPLPVQLLMRRPDLTGLPDLAGLPAGYRLRAAGPVDEPGLARVLAAAFPEMDWSEEAVRRRLTAAPDVERVYVIEREGEIAATASCRLVPERFPDSGYVHWVAAHPAHRGRRLGYWATVATLHRFAALGCPDAVLETDPPRLPAIHLYRKLGFQPVPREGAGEAEWKPVLAALGKW